jgi:hypothetical protein
LEAEIPKAGRSWTGVMPGTKQVGGIRSACVRNLDTQWSGPGKATNHQRQKTIMIKNAFAAADNLHDLVNERRLAADCDGLHALTRLELARPVLVRHPDEHHQTANFTDKIRCDISIENRDTSGCINTTRRLCHVPYACCILTACFKRCAGAGRVHHVSHHDHSQRRPDLHHDARIERLFVNVELDHIGKHHDHDAILLGAGLHPAIATI